MLGLLSKPSWVLSMALFSSWTEEFTSKQVVKHDFEQEIDEVLKVIPRKRKIDLFSITMTNKVAKLQRAYLKQFKGRNM
jgi:hypothetical protein